MCGRQHMRFPKCRHVSKSTKSITICPSVPCRWLPAVVQRWLCVILSQLARRGVLYRLSTAGGSAPSRVCTRDGYRTELHGNMCNRPRSSGDRASLLPPAASTDETETPDRLDTRMDEHERLVNGQRVRKRRISAVMRGPRAHARAPRGVLPQAPWSLDGKLS